MSNPRNRDASAASGASTNSTNTTLSDKIRVANAAEALLALELEALYDIDISQEDNVPHAPPPSPEEKAKPSAAEVLRRTLSVHSVVSTSSSFAERMEKAKRIQDTRLRVIGRGTCGTVFEVEGTEYAYKKGGDKQGIWVDANLTNTACKAVIETKTVLESLFPEISVPRVPKVFGWISKEDLESWWEKNRYRFPEGDSEKGYLFQVQRILPLPQATRTALITAYFPSRYRKRALNDPENKACLVRPYLGKRRGERELQDPPTSLQNYPLYLDQMENLGLDVWQFAKEMAVGLAIIHWKAHLDGMDIEFVLGSATIVEDLPAIVEDFRNMTPFSVKAGDFKRRQTHLWMLDFDKAEELQLKDWTKDKARMVTAVTSNDEYVPNPSNIDDRDVWKAFEDAYLKAAIHLIKFSNLEKKAKKWPQDFLKAWKTRADELKETENGDFIEFGY